MTIRYPAGPVTPHGAYYIFKGTYPEMILKAHDKSVEFFLMGGRAIPDRTQPESVRIPRDGLKGLIAPWQHIEQKGATQDGVTNIDALYDPIDVQLTAICHGRDEQHLRQVVRHLIGSIDAKQESELGFLTHDMGYWWAPIRWHKGGPPDPMSGARKTQRLSLRLRADNGFWRTYDDTDVFGFAYESMIDQFSTTYTEGLGPNWPLHYYGGSGGGYVRTRNGVAHWVDDPNDPITTQGRSVMFGPYKDFSTDTDNQVISMEFGSFQEITFPDGAENHVAGRMGRNLDGTWNGYGVVAVIGLFGVRLLRYNNFVATQMGPIQPIIPPFPGEKFSLVCGVEGNPRMFKVLRGRAQIPVLQHKESGTNSPMGAAYRGVGGGMRAGAALITQATPASVRKFNAGDNSTVSQSGFLRRTNIGDQPMYDDFTLFGPGTFKIWDGPFAKADDYVTFGPLLPNQIAFIRTDPRRRGVQDLTVIPPSPQELTQYQQALKQFLNFATGNNTPPLATAIMSQFGIKPPQGNIYSLLKGRFSDDSAIPPAGSDGLAQTYSVKVAIDNGNADSRIIAAGTPLRRWPL